MDKAKHVRAGEELNWENLESYLRNVLPDLSGKMEVAQFHGGHANLTYLVQFGQQEFIIRRPPFGKIAPGAHDMKREYRVLSKLYKVYDRAPRAYYLCEDEEIIGARFVVIERRKGVVVRYELPEVFRGIDNVETRLTDALIKALAELHKVDVEAADLTKLGRPEGFIQRQLDGWHQRWQLVEIEKNTDMQETFEILSQDVPDPQAVSIVHNDIKFDNCQFQADNPDLVTSIFDWDMTTLGDPLADLGMSLSYWPDERLKQFKNLPVALKGDFPDKKYIIEKYRDYSGFDLSRISWYESLSYWKGAVIAQQLYKRFVDGATKDQRMKGFGESAKALAMLARDIAKGI